MEIRFLLQAIRIAGDKSASGRNGPFGAVIVKDTTVIATGWNRVVEKNDPTAHAEIVAIRNACRRMKTYALDGCIVYSSCEPCPMCLSAIYWAHIRKVYFAATREDAAAAGFDDRFIYEELGRPDPEKSIRLMHVSVEQAAVPFIEWMNNPGKISY